LSKLVKLVRDQTGAALAEATVLVPVLLILFLGVFEFSHVFYQQQLIEIGVRDAARYLSRTSTGNPCDPTNVVSVGGVTLPATTAAQNVAATGSIDPSTPTRRVCTNGTCWQAASVNFTCALSAGSYLLPNGTFGPTWIITASTSFLDPSWGFFGILGLAPPTIPFTHSERNGGS
jgi:hypothetical protein